MRILRGAQETKKTRLTETRIWLVLLLLAIFLSRLCVDMFDVGSQLREFDILNITFVYFLQTINKSYLKYMADTQTDGPRYWTRKQIDV